jgi:hypothetical protein
MEGRIKPNPVLNAPPAKESDPFCTSATLLPLRPCRRNTFQKGEFPLHSHPPRARRNAASNRAFSFSQCAISARDLSSRASIWAWMSAAFFSCFRRAASKALCALATARCRRSRSFCWAASSFARSARPGCVTRCSVRPILEVPRYPPFPCSPLMAFRTTDTVFGHPNAANIWNGRFAPRVDIRRRPNQPVVPPRRNSYIFTGLFLLVD